MPAARKAVSTRYGDDVSMTRCVERMPPGGPYLTEGSGRSAEGSGKSEEGHGRSVWKFRTGRAVLHRGEHLGDAAAAEARAVARTVLGRVCGRVDGVRVGLEEVDLGAAHAAYSVSILHRERERERKSQFHQRRE